MLLQQCLTFFQIKLINVSDITFVDFNALSKLKNIYISLLQKLRYHFIMFYNPNLIKHFTNVESVNCCSVITLLKLHQLIWYNPGLSIPKAYSKSVRSSDWLNEVTTLHTALNGSAESPC